MGFLSECIADFYVSRKIISIGEKEIYKYGIELILNALVNYLTDSVNQWISADVLLNGGYLNNVNLKFSGRIIEFDF